MARSLSSPVLPAASAGTSRRSTPTAGAAIAVADLNPHAAEAAAGRPARKAGPSALAVAVDVTDEAAVSMRLSRARWPNSAAWTCWSAMPASRSWHPIEDFSFADWKKMLAIHLDGAFLTTRAAMRQMIASGKGGGDDLHGLGALQGSLGAEGALCHRQARPDRPYQGHRQGRRGHTACAPT
jgi:NAD(P)-dependent dehydrogenase (short-subunit alcohol dehydrogenase family)